MIGRPARFAPTTSTRRISGLLGTEADISVSRRSSERRRQQIIEAAAAEIRRLEAVFSIFDPTSDLVRYRAGQTGPFAPELAPVLNLARTWQRKSGGAFTPNAGVIVDRWRQAAAVGQEPPPGELEELCTVAASTAYDASPNLNLNAIAKGWIVDKTLAAMRSSSPKLDGAWIGLGGDIAHRGHGSVSVSIENPVRPFDNVPPLTRIRISNEAVASSGGGRRPLRVGDKRFSHIVDPRSGLPVDHVAGATVIAPTAAEADVIATILTVLRPAERQSFFDVAPAAVGFLIVDASGAVTKNERFRAAEVL